MIEASNAAYYAIITVLCLLHKTNSTLINYVWQRKYFTIYKSTFICLLTSTSEHTWKLVYS